MTCACHHQLFIWLRLGFQNEEAAWKTVNPGNMTTNNRTGGANNADGDLDESDLRSAGIDASRHYNLRRRHLSTIAEVR